MNNNFIELWDTLTDEQRANAEALYNRRVKALRSEGHEPRALSVYESLDEYNRDIDDIKSYDDIIAILS